MKGLAGYWGVVRCLNYSETVFGELLLSHSVSLNCLRTIDGDLLTGF